MYDSQARFKKFMTIMDSMTDEELDTENVNKLFTDTRVFRIAQASAITYAHVCSRMLTYAHAF